MIVPISGLAFVANFLVFFFSALHLWKMYKRYNSPSIKYLSIAFMSRVVFLASMAWPHVFWQNPVIFQFWMHWSQFVGFIFLTLFYIMFAHISFSFRWKNARIPILVLIAILGILFLYISYVSPNQPQIDPNTGLTLFNDDQRVGIVTGIMAMLSLLSFFIIFLIGAKRVSDSVLRRKGIILATSALFIFIGGPIHGLARDPILFLVGDIFLLSASLTILYGAIFLHNQHNSSESTT